MHPRWHFWQYSNSVCNNLETRKGWKYRRARIFEPFWWFSDRKRTQIRASWYLKRFGGFLPLKKISNGILEIPKSGTTFWNQLSQNLKMLKKLHARNASRSFLIDRKMHRSVCRPLDESPHHWRVSTISRILLNPVDYAWTICVDRPTRSLEMSKHCVNRLKRHFDMPDGGTWSKSRWWNKCQTKLTKKRNIRYTTKGLRFFITVKQPNDK